MSKTRTISEIMDEIIASTLASDPNLSDWSEHSANRITNEPIAVQIQKVEQMIYDQTLALNINTATGSDLDALVKDRGLIRLRGSRATGQVVFIRILPAEADILIPAGTEVGAPSADGNPVYFATTEDVTLLEGTISAAADVVAIEAGTRGNVRAGAITSIMGGIAGLDYCTNPSAFTGGTDSETDEDLRQRYIYTVKEPGRATNITIKEHLEALANDEGEKIVEEARIYNHGNGDVEIIVDVANVTENEPIVSDGIIENLAAGITARGMLAAHLEADSNQGNLADTAGGSLWVRALVNITSEDAFTLDYVNQNNETHQASFTVPAGTVRGAAVKGTLVPGDEVVSVPTPSYSGSFEYDALIGYGYYPYLFIRPTLQAFNIEVVLVLTDTPETGLLESIKASLEVSRAECMIGEPIQFADLVKWVYINKLTGEPFRGIEDISSMTINCKGSTIDTFGESIMLATDDRAVPGTISVREA